MTDPTPPTPSALDTIAAKLDRLLTGTSPASGDDDDTPAGRAVPYDRFQRVNARRTEAERGLAALAEEIKAARAGHADEMKKAREGWALEVTRLQSRHAEDLGLADLDDIGRSTVRTAWAAQPEATRPKSALEWWRAVKAAHAAHHADPEKAPAPEVHATVAALLPRPTVTPAVQTRQQPAPRRGAPRQQGASAVDDARGQGRAAMLAAMAKDREG